MRLALTDSLSDPGSAGRPNDDAFCAADGFAAVLDGATGLGGRLLDTPSDAAWVAQQGAERLTHHSTTHHGHDLLRAALADVEARFVAERLSAPTEMYELPMASLMMVQAGPPDALTALWFGDCSALVQRPGQAIEVVGSAFDQKADEAGAAASLAASLGMGAVGHLERPEFLTLARAARNRYNTADDGDWVFAPDVRCAEHAQTATLAAPPGTWLLLATDGFLALASDYQRYDPAGLMAAARTEGLAALLRELRAIEDADPEGRRFPRFKKGDDATALLLEVR
ncbi:hypothetical protein QO010_001743 [Caulobacter ginsengisoli]|uniref:Protein phosphatase 2C domain-containing protein n=1 Tax=Caulobacter ginsengisoli TaxID=400775 RepID=A0ABU0IPP3_9CAUL|nr:protein phosphatase 2C domain-containing protein [Caulobacter ginsengisoli]MDQ0463972.1 hypothetical protein [Caulobacter ginsengisoli]